MHDDLDDLLAGARDRGPEPGADLLARILADAEAVQDSRIAAAPVRPARWGRILAILLGGAGATAGMATAALAGVWIGYAQPETLTTVTSALWVDQRVDLLPSYDFASE